MQIIHGFSEEELKKIPDNSIDLVFTSPPYADRRKNTYGGIPESEYVDWFKSIFKPTFISTWKSIFSPAIFFYKPKTHFSF